MSGLKVCPIDLSEMEQISEDLSQCPFCGRTELCPWEESAARSLPSFLHTEKSEW